MKNTFYLSLIGLSLTNAGLSQGTQALDCDWADAFLPTTAVSGQGNCVTANATDVYSSGIFNGTFDFDPSGSSSTLTATGPSDMYISKITTGNAFVWAKQIGGAGSGVEQPQHIIEYNSSIYVVGYFNGSTDFDLSSASGSSTSAGSNDIFLAKYDAFGNFVWRRTMGSTGADQGYGLTLDAAGNLVICGSFTGTVDFDPGAGVSNLSAGASGTDAFFAKYTQAGTFVFARRVGDGASSNEVAYNVRTNISNEIFICGAFSSASCDFDPSAAIVTKPLVGSSDGYVARYSSTGVYTYATVYGTTAGDAVNDLAIDSQSYVYFVGNFGSVGVGTTTSSTPAGITLVNAGGSATSDIALACLDFSGTPVWAQSFGGTERELGTGIELDDPNHIYITGAFSSSTVDFDYSGATYNAVNAGAAGTYDIYYARYRTTGFFNDVSQIGGTGNESCSEIWARPGVQRLFSTGYFQGTTPIDFDPDAINTDMLSAAFSAVATPFVATYNYVGVPAIAISNDLDAEDQTIEEAIALGTPENLEGFANFECYPNPTTGVIYLGNISSGSKISIYSAAGTLMSSIEVLSESLVSADLTEFAPGLYVVHVLNPDGSIQTKKMLKQ